MLASSKRRSGFTLIELMVVMAVLGLLATLVVPRYFKSVDRAKEAVLRSNLSEVRSAIDKRFSDTGQYPSDLKQLVDDHYLRKLPVDPVTDRSDSWVLIKPEDATLGGLFDIKSGAPGNASDGSSYATW